VSLPRPARPFCPKRLGAHNPEVFLGADDAVEDFRAAAFGHGAHAGAFGDGFGAGFGEDEAADFRGDFEDFEDPRAAVGAGVVAGGAAGAFVEALGVPGQPQGLQQVLPGLVGLLALGADFADEALADDGGEGGGAGQSIGNMREDQ